MEDSATLSNLPSLRITASKGVIKLAAKNKGEVSIRNIQLKLLWGYCWRQGLPAVETFLELFENAIKKVIYDVLPNHELLIDYDLETNDALESSSLVILTFNEVCADQISFELIGDVIALEGLDDRGSFSKLTSFRRKLKENVRKVL